MIHRSIPPDLEQYIETAISSGKYSNEDELVCEALRTLRDRDLQFQELRSKIEPAAKRLQSGEGIRLSSEDDLLAFFDEIKSRGRDRLEKG